MNKYKCPNCGRISNSDSINRSTCLSYNGNENDISGLTLLDTSKALLRGYKRSIFHCPICKERRNGWEEAKYRNDLPEDLFTL